VLRELGARSGEAKPGEEACAIAAEAFGAYPKDVPFALLYLLDGDGRVARLAGATSDIGLPGISGLEVARAMRADPELRGLVLVALTGYATPDDLARCLEAGFDAHLAKPPSLEKLAEILGGGDAGGGLRPGSDGPLGPEHGAHG
jgi:CheY-like chemotaxis protein